MKSTITLLVAAFIAVSAALAETDYLAMPYIMDIRDGVVGPNAINDLYVSDDATIVDDASVGGSLTVSGSASVGAILAYTPVTLALTNGQAISPTATLYELQPEEAVITNTIALPYSVGDTLILYVNATNDGSVVIADNAAAMALGSDVTLAKTDTLMLLFTGTNTAVKLGGSTN